MNGNKSVGYAVEASKHPVAAEVAEFCQNLANRAQALAGHVDDKLQSVMTSAAPACEALGEKAGREYPPLFSDLQSSLRRIEGAFDRIEYALNRTEL